MRVQGGVDIKRFLSKIAQASGSMNREAKKIMEEKIEELETESLAEVPRDTGTLARSSYRQVESKKGSVEGIVGYGAGDELNPESKKAAHQYMLAVHENLHVFHPTGKAKFLEDPARRVATKLVEEYGDRAKMELEKIFREG